MNRQYTAVEILAWEDNALAIERAMDVLKARLLAAPAVVLQDVAGRIDPEVHAPLAEWLKTHPDYAVTPKSRRVPKAWSPRHNPNVYILYNAADLSCPEEPKLPKKRR